MKVKATLVDFSLIAVVAVAAVLALAAVVAVVMGGMFDGHKTAGWSWDRQVTAGTVIVLAPDSGMADGNGRMDA